MRGLGPNRLFETGDLYYIDSFGQRNTASPLVTGIGSSRGSFIRRPSTSNSGSQAGTSSSRSVICLQAYPSRERPSQAKCRSTSASKAPASIASVIRRR